MVEEKKMYHLGIKAKGPASFVTLGGQCFPTYTRRYENDDDQEGSRLQGAVQKLSTSQVAKINEALSDRVVEWVGRIDNKSYAEGLRGIGPEDRFYRVRVWSKSVTGFNPDPVNTYPLKNYIYFNEIQSMEQVFYGAGPTVSEAEDRDFRKAEEREAMLKKSAELQEIEAEGREGSSLNPHEKVLVEKRGRGRPRKS